MSEQRNEEFVASITNLIKASVDAGKEESADEIASLRAQLASGKAYDDLREQHIAKLEAQLASARKALEEIKSKGTTTGYGRTALARIAAMTLSSLTDEQRKD